MLATGCGSDDSPGNAPVPGPATAGASAGAGGSATSGVVDPDPSSGGSSDSSTGPAPACTPRTEADDCAAGERCSHVDGNCYPAGDGRRGDACTFTDEALLLDDCGVGMFCALGQGDAPRCELVCLGSNTPCESPDDRCVPFTGAGPEALCLANCDPFTDATPCPQSSDACYVISDVTGEGVAVCLPAGLSAEEGPCNLANDCLPGLGCTASELHTSNCSGAGACCAALCEPQAPDCGGVDFMCYAVDDDATVGICGIPDGG